MILGLIEIIAKLLYSDPHVSQPYIVGCPEKSDFNNCGIRDTKPTTPPINNANNNKNNFNAISILNQPFGPIVVTAVQSTISTSTSCSLNIIEKDIDLRYAVREYRTAIYVYSMWQHFLDFLETNDTGIILIQNTKSQVKEEEIRNKLTYDSSVMGNFIKPKLSDPLNHSIESEINQYTRRKRLNVFLKLSEGISLSTSDIMESPGK